jgi:hypothetical protein
LISDFGRQLQLLEESLWIADTRFDYAYLDSVLAPEFIEFGRSGRVYTRADTMGMEPAEFSATIPLRDFAAHEIGDRVVLTTYVSVVRHGETEERANRSSIWVWAHERWQLRFHQGTPVRPQ